MTNMQTSRYFVNVPLERLFEVFLAGPDRFRRSISGVTEEQMRSHPITGKWSIKEIAVHLVDSEMVAAVRFRQAITSSDSNLAFYDQDIWAKDLQYQEMTDAYVESALALFAGIRITTASLLSYMPEDIWQRAGIHPRRGRMTVREMFGLYAGHCERHIAQILERRRLLGNPLEMQPLLSLD